MDRTENLVEILRCIKNKRNIVPIDVRLMIFKTKIKENKERPEKIKSIIVRELLETDIQYIKKTIENKWKVDGNDVLEKIDKYINEENIGEEIDFQQHSYYCYHISGLLSGLSIDEVRKRYDTQLKTMVKGVVHPHGKWTPKTEIENQTYAKYICHVSMTGLVSIKKVNETTALKIEEEYMGIRILGVACAEKVGFDGIEDCGSVKVLEHDIIHSGFMKRSLQVNESLYWKKLAQIGYIYEKIQTDTQLSQNETLKSQVEAAFFMFTHELTTSVFVNGLPLSLPRKHLTLRNKYSNSPQCILKWASKLHIIPNLFVKEIETEQYMLNSLGLNILGLNNQNMSDNDKVKEIIDHLHHGYEYLNYNFKDFYNESIWLRFSNFFSFN